MKKYNIAFSINNNYLFFCFVTIHSLVKNNPDSFFNIYIQHNNCINKNDITKITSLPPLNNFNNFEISLLDMSNIKELSDIEDGGKWTKEIYFKLFLPDLLPNEDRILHLDADVAVVGNIDSILNKNIDNLIFCGDDVAGRLNCGVLLINLNNARKEKICEKSLAKIKDQYLKGERNFYNLAEEYAINALFSKNITYFDNVITISSKNNIQDIKNYKIVHYLGIKPWHLDRKVSKSIKPLYLLYLYSLKELSKNKLLTIFVFYYLLYGGYLVNNIVRRIKNSIYKNVFKIPKYKYLHNGLTMQFFIKNSIISK